MLNNDSANGNLAVPSRSHLQAESRRSRLPRSELRATEEEKRCVPMGGRTVPVAHAGHRGLSTYAAGTRRLQTEQPSAGFPMAVVLCLKGVRTGIKTLPAAPSFKAYAAGSVTSDVCSTRRNTDLSTTLRHRDGGDRGPSGVTMLAVGGLMYTIGAQWCTPAGGRTRTRGSSGIPGCFKCSFRAALLADRGRPVVNGSRHHADPDSRSRARVQASSRRSMAARKRGHATGSGAVQFMTSSTMRLAARTCSS